MYLKKTINNLDSYLNYIIKTPFKKSFIVQNFKFTFSKKLPYYIITNLKKIKLYSLKPTLSQKQITKLSKLIYNVIDELNTLIIFKDISSKCAKKDKDYIYCLMGYINKYNLKILYKSMQNNFYAVYSFNDSIIFFNKNRKLTSLSSLVLGHEIGHFIYYNSSNNSIIPPLDFEIIADKFLLNIIPKNNKKLFNKAEKFSFDNESNYDKTTRLLKNS